MGLRLYETEPGRSTALATVTARRGDAFALDRTLFRPRSRAFRHPQRADEGEIRVHGGDKHRVVGVFEDGGEVWHRTEGPPPGVGARVQCALDALRRALDSRAHTALHLLLAALQAPVDLPLAADPEVKGGGRFRLDLAAPYVPPPRLADALRRVAGHVAADLPVSRGHIAADEAARRLTPQAFLPPDPYPGPPGTSWPVAEVPGVCTYPCDGTHCARTGDVGRVVLREARRAGDRFLLVGEVGPAP